MKINIIAALIISSALLVGCATTDSYHEPANSSNQHAVIKTDNTNLAEYALGSLIMKPDNSITLTKVDGKATGFFVTDNTRISPGRHQLTFTCSLNGRVFGTREISINASAGKTYTVAFPSYLHGYAVDFNACNKITIR